MFSEMMMNQLMRFAEPHLTKIPVWLKDLAKEYEVEEAYLMIRSKTDDTGKEIPTMVVMGKKDGALIVVKDKQGAPLEYGVESLLGMIKGSED